MKSAARLGFVILLLSLLSMVMGAGLDAIVKRLTAGGDNAPGPGSVFLHTDTRTGCQYLVALHAGMFPRLGADGRPMCKEPRS